MTSGTHLTVSAVVISGALCLALARGAVGQKPEAWRPIATKLQAFFPQPVPARLTLALAADNVQTATSGGTVPAQRGRRGTPLASSFRLELDGLDAGSVLRIESFGVSLGGAPAAGKRRVGFGAASGTGRIVFPNLEVTLQQGTADTWVRWFEEFVIRGRNGEENEKAGKLTLLTADGRTSILALEFRGVGIAALRPADAGPGRAPLLKATCTSRT